MPGFFLANIKEGTYQLFQQLENRSLNFKS